VRGQTANVRFRISKFDSKRMQSCLAFSMLLRIRRESLREPETCKLTTPFPHLVKQYVRASHQVGEAVQKGIRRLGSPFQVFGQIAGKRRGKRLQIPLGRHAASVSPRHGSVANLRSLHLLISALVPV
jgi:hypothetical protein